MRRRWASYVIMVYDVGVERLPRVLRISRMYMTRVQNSVFEGELSGADLMRLRGALENVIDKERDSVIFYLFRAPYEDKVVLGSAKGEPSQFL
ncbi:MAG: CRISPR-associated endonuclease Cas2 [Nitrososphaeria archaeon]